jgi:ribose 5-phosphate isomerase B
MEGEAMKIAIGGDQAGYTLKARLIDALQAWGHEVEHIGAERGEEVDFPDISQAACAALLAGRANKVPGIRAALCHDVHSAHQSVEHDNANVLCLGAQIVGEWLALDLVRTYLNARYDDREPYRRRLAKLAALEQTATRRSPTIT